MLKVKISIVILLLTILLCCILGCSTPPTTPAPPPPPKQAIDSLADEFNHKAVFRYKGMEYIAFSLTWEGGLVIINTTKDSLEVAQLQKNLKKK